MTKNTSSPDKPSKHGTKKSSSSNKCRLQYDNRKYVDRGRLFMLQINKEIMTQEKARIVLEFLNTSTSAAELCRKHNISPATFQDWKDKFMAGGKQALAGRGDVAKIQP